MPDSMATLVLNMTTSRKRRNPYTNVACQECKRRKVKCSGDNPCAGCQQVQAICLYERSTRFRAGRRSSMISSRSRDDAAASAVSSDKPVGDAPSAVPGDVSAGHDVEYSPQPIRPGSSDYYFNLAQQLLVGPSPNDSQAGENTQSGMPRMAQDLRKLIQERSGRTSRPLLSIIALPRWLEIIDFYEEEIGLLYPFLDITDLRNQLRDIASNTPGQESRPEARLSSKLEEVLMLVLAVMAVLEEPDICALCDEFAEQVTTNTWRRAHTGNVTDHDISLSILMSIYYFMTDRESLAWRNIGSVVRMLQELGYHNSSDIQHRFKSRGARDKAKKTLWSAYMLDHRWSFGTGLPFAIHDSDIDYDTDFMDDSLSSAYLKSMVSYCRIATQVRDSALSMPSPNHAKDSARDLLDFKVGEWRRNLPQCLQFHPDMDFDPLKGTRGQYRLRLLLYLRANQMRIVIHRKSALRSGSDAIDTSSVNAMVEVAQDTIRVLVKLTQASNIYHAQQKTFNHFLESALSALLLVTCRSQAMADRSCAAEVQLALEVIDRLSTSSSITRRLAEKLKCFTTANSENGQPTKKSTSKQSSKNPPARFSNGSIQGLVANETPGALQWLPGGSTDQISNVTGQSHSEGLYQSTPIPGSDRNLDPSEDMIVNSQHSYPTVANHELSGNAQFSSLEHVTSDTVPPLLYSQSGASEISPNSMPADPALLDVVDGLPMVTSEKWDGLLTELGEFWVDYDRMITF